MQKEKLKTEFVEKVVKTLLEKPELTNKMVGEMYGITYQKVASIKKTFVKDGAGDVVEKITEATGIKKLVEMFTPEGKDCGCDERKLLLNKIKPRLTVINCLKETEFAYLDNFFKNWDGLYSPKREVMIVLEQIRARVFNLKFRLTSCATCIRNDLKELRRIYEIYQVD